MVALAVVAPQMEPQQMLEVLETHHQHRLLKETMAAVVKILIVEAAVVAQVPLA
jgi:hypothetical protein